MVNEVQSYIKSLNFGYRKILREKTVTYLNAYAQFVDAHTIKVSFKFNHTCCSTVKLVRDVYLRLYKKK